MCCQADARRPRFGTIEQSQVSPLQPKTPWFILAAVLILALGIFLGVVVGLLEFLVGIIVPVAACAVLAWFGYKLLLQPVLRQRKLDRIRAHRARRAAERLDEEAGQ